MEMAPAQEGLLDMEKHLEDHRTAIRRADAVLMLVATLVATVVIFLPGVREHTNLSVALAVVASAVIATVTVYRFPWHRHHPDLFVVVGAASVAMVSVLIWATGGPQSPFYLFYFFVVVATGAYHRTRWSIALIIGLSVVGAASSLISASRLDMRAVAFLSVLIVVFLTVAIITAIFFRSLANTTELLEKRVRELTALNKMFQEYLRRDQSLSSGGSLSRDCLERIKAAIAQLDQLLPRPSS